MPRVYAGQSGLCGRLGGMKMTVHFFFFKQKTAYEMRISDWSSDVCSSDLLHLKPHVTGWARLDRIWGGTTDVQYLRNNRSGRVALCVPSWSITDDEGRPVKMLEFVRPTGSKRIQLAELWQTFWKEIDRDSFKAFWDVEVDRKSTRLNSSH